MKLIWSQWWRTTDCILLLFCVLYFLSPVRSPHFLRHLHFKTRVFVFVAVWSQVKATLSGFWPLWANESREGRISLCGSFHCCCLLNISKLGKLDFRSIESLWLYSEFIRHILTPGSSDTNTWSVARHVRVWHTKYTSCVSFGHSGKACQLTPVMCIVSFQNKLLFTKKMQFLLTACVQSLSK